MSARSSSNKNPQQIGVDAQGHGTIRKAVRRQHLLATFAKLPPCLIGIEACANAHHWARKLEELGHAVRLMAPQFVKPYVKSNKNDAADAEAICEAVRRPNMRFVPIKSSEQQAVLSLHRARQGFVKARTAQANQIRGLLAEFGHVIPQGICHVTKELALIIDAEQCNLPRVFVDLLRRLGEHLRELDRHVGELEVQIQLWHRQSLASTKLASIPGVGAITASAIVASIGDAKCFSDGRQPAAWLGLVPRQHSSGGKPTLLGISKRGDAYLRTLLIHGARSVIRVAQGKQHTGSWLNKLLERRSVNVAAIALANKNARIAWALLTRGTEYQPA